MTGDFIVRGDHLPVLGAVAVSQAAATDEPRALIWGVDLSGDRTRRAVTRHLRSSGRDALRVAASQSGLRHVFLTFSHGGAMPTGSCMGAASQTAAFVHSGLERAQGRYLDVIAIDLPGWEDDNALCSRIVEATATRAGAAGDVALGWHEIVDTSIQAAAMRRLC